MMVVVGFCGLEAAAFAKAAPAGWEPLGQADEQDVGEGLQTLAQNDRRGLKTPTYDLLELWENSRVPVISTTAPPKLRVSTLRGAP